MRGVTLWEKDSVNNERKDLPELCRNRNAVWKRDVVSKVEWDRNFENKTEKVMMIAMYGVKIIGKRNSQELMSLLGLKNTLDGLARASGMQRYVHVLRRDNGDVLRRALDFEVAARRGHRRPNMTWKRPVEKHTDQIGLKREDAIDRVKWRNRVYELSRSTK